jgi:hypothetical protein
MGETVQVDAVTYELVEGTPEQPLRVQGADGVFLIERWGTPTVLTLVEPSAEWREARDAEEAARVRRPDPGGFLLAIYDEKVGLGEERGLELARLRPDFALAVQLGRFDVAREVLDRVRVRSTITEGEYETLVTLMAAFHLP